MAKMQMNTKVYLLFGGKRYYASGGWGDFIGCFGTIEDAQKALEESNFDENKHWAHIVDFKAQMIVLERKRDKWIRFEGCSLFYLFDDNRLLTHKREDIKP